MNQSSVFTGWQDIDLSDIGSWPVSAKLVGSLLVGLLIIGISYFLMITNTNAHYQAAAAEETSLKTEFQKKYQQATNLPQYQQQLVEVRTRYQTLIQQLPNKTEVPALLTAISDAGTSNGLQFKEFRPAPPLETDFFMTIPIEVKTAGSYHQLARYISDIANFQRIVSVGNLSLSRAVSSPNSPAPELNLEADLVTYQYQAESDTDAAPRESQP